jgi:hypothetical protein
MMRIFCNPTPVLFEPSKDSSFEDSILLEAGGQLLTETGDLLMMERSGVAAAMGVPVLLLENGENILTESSGLVLLE